MIQIEELREKMKDSIIPHQIIEVVRILLEQISQKCKMVEELRIENCKLKGTVTEQDSKAAQEK